MLLLVALAAALLAEHPRQIAAHKFVEKMAAARAETLGMTLDAYKQTLGAYVQGRIPAARLGGYVSGGIPSVHPLVSPRRALAAAFSAHGVGSGYGLLGARKPATTADVTPRLALASGLGAERALGLRMMVRRGIDGMYSS